MSAVASPARSAGQARSTCRVSLTTPTTVSHESPCGSRKRCPMADRPGHRRRADAASTTANGSAAASDRVKARPSRSASCPVARERHRAAPVRRPGSSRGSGGTLPAIAAASTPGNRAKPVESSSMNLYHDSPSVRATGRLRLTTTVRSFVEPRVDPMPVDEAADQQSGPGQQHQAQGNLGHHQQGGEAPPRPASGTLGERQSGGGLARRAQSRDEPDRGASSHREPGVLARPRNVGPRAGAVRRSTHGPRRNHRSDASRPARWSSLRLALTSLERPRTLPLQGGLMYRHAVISTCFLLLFVLAPSTVEAAWHCRFFFLTAERRVHGPVNVECGDVHSPPFGNWGVTSPYAAAYDGHQFPGWKYDDGWLQWNSCTSQYNTPDYLPDGPTQRANPDAISAFAPVPINNDNLPECGELFDGYLFSFEGMTLELYELDPVVKPFGWYIYEEVAELDFGDFFVVVTCDGDRCHGETDWHRSTSTNGAVAASVKVRVDARYLP